MHASSDSSSFFERSSIDPWSIQLPESMSAIIRI
jgi:hypothetical protein